MTNRLARFLLVIVVILTFLPIITPSQDNKGASSGNAKQDDKVQLNTNLVSMTVSVTDPYGRFVTGLGKEHFEVFDEKVKQQVALFTDEDAPVSLGLLPTATNGAILVPVSLRTKLKGGTLAISDEPQGGSTTGAPTGAVLATGQLTII